MTYDPLAELRQDCGYDPEPEDVMDDGGGVDALIAYKDALEDRFSALYALADFLWEDPKQFPSGADTCEALDRELRRAGLRPTVRVRVSWDTADEEVDDEPAASASLPAVVEVPAGLVRADLSDSEDGAVADWLSDRFDFCVEGWEVEA